ncbi:integrin alpha FG-GAP repeat-containing protein 2 [Actinomortierella wolfii]|nr:integrin alpha FG-GAP repeat-containing protein 2 [Actinomortierella wolfii]
MPSIRHVSLVQKLKWHVTGNISPTAFAIGDVDSNGDNEFVIGNLVGELFVFKGSHPEGLPWLTCKGLGTITAVAIGDIRNWGRNSVVVISAEGLCHIFDISGIEDDPHIHVQYGTDGQSGVISDMGGSARQLTVPATPSLRPVPDHHHHNHHGQHHHHHHHHHGHHHHNHHIQSQGLPGSSTPRQNSTHSSFPQHANILPTSSSTTPIHTPSIGSNSRRGSEVASGTGSAGATSSTMAGSVRTTSAMLAGLIGTPMPTTTTTSTPITSMAASSVTATIGAHPPPHAVGSHHSGQHSPQIAHQHTGRSTSSNSSTTPLRPQLVVMPASSPVLTTQAGNFSPSTATRSASIATTPATHASSLPSQQQQPPQQQLSSQSTGSSQQQNPAPSTHHGQQRGSISFANASKAPSVGVAIGSETPRWRFVNGRRVIEKPNLTLPVPVNINRAQIADIDGDGINELVLARTDRILHSYALHVAKASAPIAGQNSGVGHVRKNTTVSVSNAPRPSSSAAPVTTTATVTGHHPTPSMTGSHTEGNHTLSLMKLLSRTSSISTLDSNGLLSPVEERRETAIHYPSITTSGRAGVTASGGGVGGSADPLVSTNESQNGSNTATKAALPSSSKLILVEKKRWALDGQIHCLAVSMDSETGMPLLLIAQPGLNFVMIDHKGNMIKPPNQTIRDPKSLSNLGSVPDTPTKVPGSGDVATDIVCATYYEENSDGFKPKSIIGLMSMDGVLALHDLEHQTVRVHDLDSTHKIFGFSKLNFGEHQRQQYRHHHQQQQQSHGHKEGDKAHQHEFHNAPSDSSDTDDDEDDDSTIYCRSGERLSSLKYSPRHRREYERLKKRAKKQQQGVTSSIDQDIGGDDIQLDNHDEDDEDDIHLDFDNHEEPSLFLKHPSQPALQSDIFVGCSWSGITFFIDQNFNTAQYDFESRVCAFGAGEYAITPGKNEPCLFYVDFDDNIFVYYNFHIHLEPSIPFVESVKADTRLYQAAQMQQKIYMKQQRAVTEEEQERQGQTGDKDELATASEEASHSESNPSSGLIGARQQSQPPFQSSKETMTDQDLKEFVHDSLYNANRYEDEYRELKRLLELEEAKKRTVMARMKTIEREADERREAKRCAKIAKEEQAQLLEHQARVLAFAQAQAAKGLPEQQNQDDTDAADVGEERNDEGNEGEKNLSTAANARTVTSTVDAEDNVEPIQTKLGRTSTSSSASSVAMTSPTEILAATTIPPHRGSGNGGNMSNTMTSEILGRRRGSLLIRDVLASYEGKKTPPLVLSPTATSPPSSFFASTTTAESRPSPISHATTLMPKRQSSSRGDDLASHLPPIPPTKGATASVVTAVGSANTPTAAAPGSKNGGNGGSHQPKISNSTSSTNNSRLSSGTHMHEGYGGASRVHRPPGVGQPQGHALTSLMKRLTVKDLGSGGRLVRQPTSVVNASDAAAFGFESSGSNANITEDTGSAASSPGSSSSSVSQRSETGSGSIGHGHGRVINKTGKGHFYHHHHHHHHHHRHHDHHGRPLTPGSHRSHSVVASHRGSIGRRLSARSRLVTAHQASQYDSDSPTNDDNDSPEVAGGDGASGRCDEDDNGQSGETSVRLESEQTLGKSEPGPEEDQDNTLADVEHSRTPETSRPGSKSNSRRSSQGALGSSSGTSDYFEDAEVRAVAAASRALTNLSPLHLRTSSAGNQNNPSEGGEDYDSCGGMHTPSTISPMPSPGRIFPPGQGHRSLGHTGGGTTSTEQSPSLEGAHEFALAKSLLSPPSRPPSAASMAATTLLATTKAPASTSTDTATATGTGGSTSATTSTTATAKNMGEPLDGRRSRAESVLSVGSDIGGGVILPDITLLSSSFNSSSELAPQLSAVERLRQEQERQDAAAAAISSVEDSPRLRSMPLSGAPGTRRASHDQLNSGSSSGSVSALNPALRRPPSRRSLTTGHEEM